MRKIKVKKNTATAKIWSAIRIKKKFDLDALENLAGAKKENIYKFLRVLKKGKYIIQLRKYRYSLIKNTGPLHPIFSLKKQMIYDQNTGEKIDVK